MTSTPILRPPVASADSGAIQAVLARIAATYGGEPVVTTVRYFPRREAQWRAIPEWVQSELAEAYRQRGITQLYSHQAKIAELIRAGNNVVVVTPTGSGKTLCYNLPIIHDVLANADTRALYVFPTKALAQDQLAELHDLVKRLDDCFGVFTYDGDTPADARKGIRERGHIVLTNPDMLHSAILPQHTKWMRLFENLRYIVLDELHSYRGVFGSHLANVLRRLARIAKFYGSKPQFICCSATIANPGQLAEQLIEADTVVVDENGAPAGEKVFVFYNPPLVNRNLGIRRGYLNETTQVTSELLRSKLQTIVFVNSRLHTEVLLTQLQQRQAHARGQEREIRGYRGGYLPGERREIERGLRDGEVQAVVTTNALELGIDIGSLDACVLAGYPGSIASTWQRVGRAGRRKGASCAVLVASSAPVDQFIVQHPEYFFSCSPEHAHIQPDNLEILLNHLKCAAFELPISPEERFGNVDLAELCNGLVELGFMHSSGGKWHWIQEGYPADTVSLRSVSSDNFVIIDKDGRGDGQPEVIGEIDFTSALTTVYPKAIYLHQGQQYQVEQLDFQSRKALVNPVKVDYYTEAIDYTQVRVLEIAKQEVIRGPAARASGDVLVRSEVVGFKKIKFFSHENVGSGKLELPENQMHTTSFWLTLGHELLQRLPGTVSERQNAIFGLLYALRSMATLLLMCDRRDLGVAVGERAFTTAGEIREGSFRDPAKDHSSILQMFEPSLYLYDAYPGGIGLTESLYQRSGMLLMQVRALIAACPCTNGCPSCIGPPTDSRNRTKMAALAILEELC